MNVMYTCDNNYVWIAGVSINSLFENNKHIPELNVYLLGENIFEENIAILNTLAEKYDRAITHIAVPKLDIPKSLISARWPLSAFIRLFCAQLLPDHLERILYLDCDTIITGDIEALNSVSFDDNVVLGIKDCISGLYKKNIGLNSDSPYINGGVLVFDLLSLRKMDIYREIEAYLSKYLAYINYADQDILNGIFKGKVGELHPRYDVMTIDVVHSYKEILMLRHPTNFYSERTLREAVAHPAIIHYTTNMLVVRPWYMNTNHPMACEFKRYLEISPWSNTVLGFMNFSSRESMLISKISKLPKSVAHLILGCIHAEVRPIVICLRARKRK